MVNYITEDRDLISKFEDIGALLHGHFFLSAGLHSASYVQCSRITSNPTRAEYFFNRLAQKVTDQFGENAFDVVVGPAMGGVIPSYELGRQFGIKAMFCERVNGIFELRRGFHLDENTRVLIAEDVVTTGKSSMEAIECVQKYGAKIIAEACLVNRNASQIKNINGLPLVSLLELDIVTYLPEEVPEELKKIPVTKPGSRFLK